EYIRLRRFLLRFWGFWVFGGLFGFALWMSARSGQLGAVGVLLLSGRLGATASKIKKRGIRDLKLRRAEYARIVHGNNNRFRQLSANVPIFLILRSFGSDNARYLQAPLRFDFLNPLRYLRSRAPFVEQLIVEAAQNWGPVFAIGSPSEVPFRSVEEELHEPAAYIETEGEEWKDYFHSIASCARGIVMFPSSSPGLVEEVEWVRAKVLLDRCIFVMPPAFFSKSDDRLTDLVSEQVGLQFGSSAKTATWHAAQWQLAVEAFSKLRIELPEYDKSGLVFGLNNDGAIKQVFWPLTRELRPATYKVPCAIFRWQLLMMTILFGEIPAGNPRHWPLQPQKRPSEFPDSRLKSP
ncbi:MAG TPA: hypothetical protein VGP63_03915, partial [Planctomycetaceae bacterium]|nr:hypothetical protein [Planctomycetaceae bacterium]